MTGIVFVAEKPIQVEYIFCPVITPTAKSINFILSLYDIVGNS